MWRHRSGEAGALGVQVLRWDPPESTAAAAQTGLGHLHPQEPGESSVSQQRQPCGPQPDDLTVKFIQFPFEYMINIIAKNFLPQTNVVFCNALP